MGRIARLCGVCNHRKRPLTLTKEDTCLSFAAWVVTTWATVATGTVFLLGWFSLEAFALASEKKQRFFSICDPILRTSSVTLVKGKLQGEQGMFREQRKGLVSGGHIRGP